MKFSESDLNKFAAPLSNSEDEQCKHAIEMVRDALKPLGYSDDGIAVSKLYPDTFAYRLEMRNSKSDRRVTILLQGSYANNTNVRQESDVDIAVIQEEQFRPKYRSSQSGADYGFVSAVKRPTSFKDEVQECLEKKFGKDVERKNKSIKIHGNTYRKDADTVPSLRYRDYTGDYYRDENNYVGGILIKADDGEEIINFPEQHIKNGREKNIATNHHYKEAVRIFKTMKNMIADQGDTYVGKVGSFQVESLLWNLPDDIFKLYGKISKGKMIERIISYLIDHIDSFDQYTEANGIKPLCKNEYDKNILELFSYKVDKFFEYI